jgi:hypothetical protein
VRNSSGVGSGVGMGVGVGVRNSSGVGSRVGTGVGANNLLGVDIYSLNFALALSQTHQCAWL